MATTLRAMRLLFCMAALAIGNSPLQAHPHVWATYRTTVLFEQGEIAGFRHAWTFDEMYSAMAVVGLDKDGNGSYSREELSELAQVNADSLGDFSYFTYPKLGETALRIAPPRDYWLEYANGRLTLHFTLPLATPVPADAVDFTFSVFDETFFIAFEIEKDQPVMLGAGAPNGCSAIASVSQQDLDQLRDLSAAFSGAMTSGDQNIGDGALYAQTIALHCPVADRP